MDAEKMMKLQMQLSQNNNDLAEYMKDLNNWQEDIKIKETKLNLDESHISNLPSIRNLPVKNSNNKKTNFVKEKKSMPAPYSSWDKFDADKACEELDFSEVDKNGIQKLVEKFKSEGNEYFKRNKLKEALESYTKGLEIDSSNINLLANRALVLLKQENYAACEMDCNAALTIENKNVKCLLRRGTARSKLKKYNEALYDFKAVLNIEKRNKQALMEVEVLNQLIKTIDSNIIKPNVNETGVVKAIYKPINQRSKKPMKRVNITEINVNKIQPVIKPIDITISGKREDNKNNSENDKISNSKSIIESLPANKSKSMLISSEIKILDENFSSATENSFQFQKAWKQLKNNDKQFFTYFSKFQPIDYPKIFGECLEYNMLSKIWSLLRNLNIEKKLDPKLVLLNLPRISRFQMNMMFLTPEDKKILNYIVSDCKNLSNEEEAYLQDIYELKL